MNKWTIVACSALSIACTRSAQSYDAETHALIAYKAYGQSALSQTGTGSLVARLTLDRLEIPTPFNTYWQAVGSTPGPLAYYDTTSASGFDRDATPRQPDVYEQCQMQHLAPRPPKETGTNWLKDD